MQIIYAFFAQIGYLEGGGRGMNLQTLPKAHLSNNTYLGGKIHAKIDSSKFKSVYFDESPAI